MKIKLNATINIELDNDFSQELMMVGHEENDTTYSDCAKKLQKELSCTFLIGLFKNLLKRLLDDIVAPRFREVALTLTQSQLCKQFEQTAV